VIELGCTCNSTPRLVHFSQLAAISRQSRAAAQVVIAESQTLPPIGLC